MTKTVDLSLISQRAAQLQAPQPMGSYSPDDCVFLLKDVTSLVKEQGNEERERAIQSGVHYSEMLPVEYVPNASYVKLFHSMLDSASETIARYVAVVSEQILKLKHTDQEEPLVLVSLARAGTPIGVLIKRYIKQVHQIDLPHYSISIIREKGFDENALAYIIDTHKTTNLQFIDGWTGKGAINVALKEACEDFEQKFGIRLDERMAVLADPSAAVSIFGTREDIVIPSACLNSTVSGLMSRTFQKDGLIGEYDFHGSKYYKEFSDINLSNYYVDHIAAHFADMTLTDANFPKDTTVRNSGMAEVLEIGKVFGIPNHQLIKSGINETSRVLLRRIPWKIIVDRLDNPELTHILMLAKERNVPVEEYTEMGYACCGLIKDMNGDELS